MIIFCFNLNNFIINFYKCKQGCPLVEQFSSWVQGGQNLEEVAFGRDGELLKGTLRLFVFQGSLHRTWLVVFPCGIFLAS